MGRGTNATRSSQPAARKRSLCARIIGSVMDLHSRRPGMFENSRSSGMWLAEPPSATSLFSLLSPALQTSPRRNGRCSDAYLPPSLCSAILPRSRRGHRLGAPNSRVTKDAPLAWLGRARLLGAQMMYVDHFCLSSSLAFAHASCCYSLRFLCSPSTYLCASTANGKEIL